MKRMLRLTVSIMLILLTLASLFACSHEHTFGEWIVDLEPTYTESGSRHRVCQECGEEESETLEKLPHDHSYGNWIVDLEPTTDAEGSRYKTCSICGDELRESMPKIDHNHTFGDWIIDTAPTWDTAGAKHKVCSSCQEERFESIPKVADDPNHRHTFGDWIIDSTPTFDEIGNKHKVCSSCQKVEREDIEKIPVAYTITIVNGTETSVVRVAADGAYTLPSPANKLGWRFVGFVDSNNEPFSTTGTIQASTQIAAVYELLPTTTFAELKERMEAGVDIVLAGNITLTETIFVSENVTITASGSYTLTRATDFLGDLFIIGCYPDGSSTVLKGHTATLTIDPGTEHTITIDGNKAQMTDNVTGTAFLLKNSATFHMHANVTIANCKKLSNAYLLADGHNISDPEKAGGAAVIITGGVFRMYGGTIRDCEVSATDDGNSSRGGAIFNYGTFEMYDGVITNCNAARGGALYNYRIMYLYGGEVSDNSCTTYGGALYNPNSQYVYLVIGQPGTDIKMTIKGNTSAKTGGAIYAAHQSSVYVIGSTLFKENSAASGNGGALNIAGELVVDYAKFEGNTASSKGGAIYAYFNSAENQKRVIHIKNALFTENEAPRGGAIGLGRGDAVDTGAVLKLGDVTFQSNKAPIASSNYGYGAAIHIDSASTATIYGNTTFSQNTSDGNGGAIYITKKSSLRVTAETGVTVKFEENSSTTGNGGAIYNSGSTVVLLADGGAIQFNRNASIAEKGGAIAVHSGGTVKLYGISATENTATLGAGGFLYLYGGNAVIGDATYPQGATLSANSAKKGGAIYVEATGSAAASLTATSITLTGNSSTDNGGALYLYTEAIVTIGSINATQNQAGSTKYGGVAYISGEAQVTIGSINASANTAGSGGCIYLTTSGTSLTIDGGDIKGNSASAADKGNAVWVNSTGSVLKLKTDADDQVLLEYTEGEILGKSGFQITKYKEAV